MPMLLNAELYTMQCLAKKTLPMQFVIKKSKFCIPESRPPPPQKKCHNMRNVNVAQVVPRPSSQSTHRRIASSTLNTPSLVASTSNHSLW